jgi:hypothetical protein
MVECVLVEHEVAGSSPVHSAKMWALPAARATLIRHGR